jgi:hypothetical protein
MNKVRYEMVNYLNVFKIRELEEVINNNINNR